MDESLQLYWKALTYVVLSTGVMSFCSSRTVHLFQIEKYICEITQMAELNEALLAK